MFTKQYQLYLRSAAWKMKREQAFRYYGRRCQVCGSRRRLEINHLSYKNLFHEPMQDLSVLCHDCHLRYTRLRRRMNRRKYTGHYILKMMRQAAKKG